MPVRLRAGLVWLHRYVGLVMAAFIVLAGVTGAVLAWYHAFDAAINPQWLRVHTPSADARPLPALVLRERVLARHPGAEVNFVPLTHTPGAPAVFFIVGPEDPATGEHLPIEEDEVFVNPYTGQVLGGRRWGDITQGWSNLMPFIYRLHYQVALGAVGTTVFGVIALLWTLDCFIGAALTLPRAPAASLPRKASWWRRWMPAWRLRWNQGRYKRWFDLHRAGGLWLWAWMFVFAWSSVAFNLGGVYYPAMHAIAGTQEPPAAPVVKPLPRDEPAMGWPAGLARGRELMAQVARDKGFVVLNEERLSYSPHRGSFHYRVRSNRDIRDRRGITSIDFDAATGALLSRYVPTGESGGDTFTTWLLALHMADVWGQPFKLAVFLLGLASAGLSGTGVYIWWKKRAARRAAAARARASPDVNP